MTSDIEAEDGDEERWAQAESILAGGPSDDAWRSVRRRRNQLLLVIGGSAVLGAALGLLAGLLLPSHHHHSSHQIGWSGVAGLVLTCAGVLVEIAAIVLLVRRGRWREGWRGPLMVLTRRQRRSLFQQIRGRRPVEPARLPLARYIAERWLDQSRLMLPIFIGAALIGFGNLFITPDVFHYWLAGYWVALVVLMFVLWGWQRRGARRFLEAHTAPQD